MAIELYFYLKITYFSPTGAWNGTWRRLKWPQVMFSYGLGYDMAQETDSAETPYPANSLLLRHDFDQKMSHFWTPADLKWYLEMASMAPSHLAICKTKILVHYEFKVRINVVGRAKNLPK